MVGSKLGWSVFLVACASLAAVAMPTKSDFQKVQLAVDELLEADRAAVKAGKMKPVKAGENAVHLAEQSKDAAAQYMFWQAAFNYFVKGGEFDRAYDAIQSFRAVVPDIPDTEMIRVLRNGLRGASQKNGGKLYEVLQEVENRVRYARERDQLVKNVAKRPADAMLRVRLAERYVLLGDWEKALPEFAESVGDVATAAKAELGKQSLAYDKIADIWWSYVIPGEDGAEKHFRAHAVDCYRKALAEGRLDGLRRTLVEKRIGDLGSTETGSSVFKVNGNLAKLYYDGTNYIEFVKCPAGEFNMTFDFKSRKTIKARITSPLWIMKEFGGIQLKYGKKFKSHKPGDGKQPAWSAYRDIENLVRRLMSECGEGLPEGYVVRLPTNAELQYALCGGASRLDIKSLARQNTWNLDIGKGKTHWILDRFPTNALKFNNPPRWECSSLPRLDGSEDPLGWDADDAKCAHIIWRMDHGDWLGVADVNNKHAGSGFRFVIGPDLVDEWWQKHGK